MDNSKKITHKLSGVSVFVPKGWSVIPFPFGYGGYYMLGPGKMEKLLLVFSVHRPEDPGESEAGKGIHEYTKHGDFYCAEIRVEGAPRNRDRIWEADVNGLVVRFACAYHSKDEEEVLQAMEPVISSVQLPGAGEA